MKLTTVCTLLPTNHVLVVGSFQGPHSAALFDIKNNSWEKLEDLEYNREGATLVNLSGRIFIIGGYYYTINEEFHYANRSQFHKYFMCTFCANILVPKNFKAKNVTKEKLHKALSYEKFVLKMLMKLTTDLNFINILHTIFCTTVLCRAFLYFLIGFVFFVERISVQKMLVKYW